MEPGNWIALAAVAGGLVGNGVVWRLGTKRFDHERDLSARQATGKSLEDAAVELHETAYLLDDLRAGIRARPLTFLQTEDGEATYRGLERAGRNLDARAERLLIRLKDAPAATAFETVKDTTLTLFRAAGQIIRETDQRPDPGHAQEQVKEFVNEKRTEMEVLRDQFDIQRRAFRDAAFAEVGVSSRSSAS